jgi:hypothetical protein
MLVKVPHSPTVPCPKQASLILWTWGSGKGVAHTLIRDHLVVDAYKDGFTFNLLRIKTYGTCVSLKPIILSLWGDVSVDSETYGDFVNLE